MFEGEAEAWYNIPDFNIFDQNITVLGFSPIFPQAHCTNNGEICQMTTGEGEINAAVSITALWASNAFNLTSTYFIVAGVGGINPHIATTGSVTFARYAVQFDLQYEFSHKQVPENATSGYYPQAANYPDEFHPRDYPGEIYGTEAFELNDSLKKRAVHLARKATLNDTEAAQSYRKTYPYAPANQTPTVVECDTGTSNNYWSGSILGDAFSAYTKLLTNGSGLYCNTQQEDNAILESLMRGDLAAKLDFNRIIIMRTASDFDRAPPDETEVFHLLHAKQEGYVPSIQNLYLAGVEIVRDVLGSWEEVYRQGVKAENYVGDLWNSLGSEVEPDVGTPAIWIN
ncbi:Purine nucleoside permease [Fulvia fulva]|uniref:Purine nucleoside permease n=1 Tax=Passalora fulva TaxID=5499 RepID=A0A9Q8LHA9_PASFU|nr:Purine nucleoside permease [Fulvia fulva]KAK4624086.1 Purine nucleoside permease [Fulvia fulva]KAK4625995.1 Purine nucleoside permease [Fulvia fulva]UJO17397.1 Purine nucleoside permease [Fulvia fulva]WPV15043.1 Purine nucleoside permease [Fulvia fulva]WPV30206.1 Purine nucleoside permease [Fulvia fulva]